MKGSYRLKTSVPLAFDARAVREQKDSVVLLPLRSQRVLVTGNHVLSCGSQRQLRVEVDNECSKAFSRVEELINLKLLKRGMSSLQSKPTTQTYQTHIRRNMEELTCQNDVIPSDEWFHRRACQTFALYYYYFAQKQQRRALKHWHDIINHERTTLYHFFDRWNVKTSQIRLNGMNARRFLFLTQTLSRKLKSVATIDAMKRWLWYTQWQRHLIRIRLLFRCWKTVVQVISARRQRLRRLGIQAFKLHHEHAQIRYEDLTSSIYRLRCNNTEYRVLLAWSTALKRIRVLQRILRLHRPLYAAFYAWKSLTLIPKIPSHYQGHYSSSPRTSRNSSPTRRSHELQGGRRVVVYQSSTGAVVTRQIIAHHRDHRPPTTPNTTGRRIVVAGSGSGSVRRRSSNSHSTTPKDVKKLSPLDKLMIRLRIVKEFEESFEEIEKVRRMQHSIERKQIVAAAATVAVVNKTPIRSGGGGGSQDHSFMSQQSIGSNSRRKRQPYK